MEFLLGLSATPLLAFDKDMDKTMTSLVIDLQAGYSADEVSIQINGEEKYHNKAVGTENNLKMENLATQQTYQIDIW